MDKPELALCVCVCVVCVCVCVCVCTVEKPVTQGGSYKLLLALAVGGRL